MTAFIPLLLIGFAGLVVVRYDARRRRGDDPLGPPPSGELPDTRVALVLGAMLWALLVVIAGAVLSRSRAHSSGVVDLVAGAGPNVVAALVLLRTALGGTRKATLPARKLVAAGALGGLVAFGTCYAVGIAIQCAYALLGSDVPSQDIARQAGEAQGLDVVAYAAAAVVFAPFAEEVFFRGVLLPAAVRVAGEWRGLALQALAFGAVHVLNAPSTWPLAIPLAVVGWCAGRLYLRTGSLAAPIVLHMTFNAINFALLRAFPEAGAN